MYLCVLTIGIGRKQLLQKQLDTLALETVNKDDSAVRCCFVSNHR